MSPRRPRSEGDRRAEAALGPVSVLINNAGIAVEKLAVDQTEADWDAVINANLKGAYFAATEMARRMIARKQEGNIVNVASVLGFGVMKFLSPYTISKAGHRPGHQGDGAGTGRQPHPRQCTGARLYRHRDEPRFLVDALGEKLTKRIPQRRVGAESDLDGAILLLASGASRYMTGSVVTVDGGSC